MHSSSHSALYYTVSVLGRENRYTIKYTPLPVGVFEGEWVCLTVYPESSPNTEYIIYTINMLMIPSLISLAFIPYTPLGVYCDIYPSLRW